MVGQRLKLNDIVTVAALECGKEWAKEKHGSKWATARVEGKIAGRAIGGKWTVEFDDDFTCALDRRYIDYVRSPVRVTAEKHHVDAAKLADQMGADTTSHHDSSDDEPAPPAAARTEDSSEDEMVPDVDKDDVKKGDLGGWVRNDDVTSSARADDGHLTENQPFYTLPDYVNKELKEYALHALPEDEMQELAALMHANAETKFKEGQRAYHNFTVTVKSVLKWFGCWM